MNIPSGRRIRLAFVLVIATLSAGLPGAAAESTNTLTTPDFGPGDEDVGRDSSVAVDSSGNPVIAYYESSNRDLKLLRCDDPACDPLDGGEVIAVIRSVGDVGTNPSIELDSSDNPVIAYDDGTQGSVRVLHCDDPVCAPGGDAVVALSGARDGSLQLDASGNPVVAAYDYVNSGLKILRCGDPTCTPALASVNPVDTGGTVGQPQPSLRLDASGNPVVAYRNAGDRDLKVLHCNDPACAPGGDSITSPDTAGSVGLRPSLALDSSGNPVISHYDSGNDDLRVVHCNDPNCAGGDESITVPDSAGNVGDGSSLALDPAGNPLIAYVDVDNGDLRYLHCDDPNCAGTENPATLTADGVIGRETAMALDAAGNPVISFHDDFAGTLRLMHCGDLDCVGRPATDGFVGSRPSLVLDSSGNPVVAYHELTGEIWILRCDDPVCAPGGDSITTPDAVGPTGTGIGPSLVLDAAGNPVVAYRDPPGGLKILHCNDPLCSPGGDSITTPDLAATGDPSLQLDAAGNPVVAYYDFDSHELKILHCNDADCAPGGDSITAPDTGRAAARLRSPSLQLDSAGFPVVAYYDEAGELKILHCDEPFCFGGNDSITTPDTAGFVQNPSLRLDASGFPVVSYYDSTNGDLKILRCDEPFCFGGNDSITSPDTEGNVGSYSSLHLDAAGHPVVAYHFSADWGDLRVLRCNDPFCADGDDSITSPDIAGEVGLRPSLQLDASGFPVISYFDLTNSDLKLLRCDDPACAPGPPPSASCNGLPVTVDIGAGQVPTAGDDVILGTNGADVINAGGGNDVVCAGDGDDTVIGGDGDDRIFGGPGDDRLSGNAGSDVLNGGGGADSVFGGSGDDEVLGGGGSDVILGGGSGSDRIDGGTGDDRINGGSDNDLRLDGGVGADTVVGGGGNDRLVFGGDGDDAVAGNGGKDNLYGEAGNDTMFGGPNDDSLFGGPGDDFLGGNDGIDVCDGGPEVTADIAADNCETQIDIP